jgi:tripartite-type tricarboxylate transporter receptor subunit TctC
MDIRRREFLSLAASTAVLPAMSRIAVAEAYPSRPVRILVGFGAGGAPDVLARLVGQWLSDHLGQPFAVDNRPGAASDIATADVVHAAPDGYTLLLVSLANAVNATLDDKLTYNFIRDILPVSGISRDPDVMVVNTSFPSKTLPEFLSYAQANPGKINLASPGIGTSPHMAGELFSFMTGVRMTHVPYQSTPAAITDLLAGQVQVFFAPISIAAGYVKSGKLRALAVTTATRAAVLPDTPTVGDFVPGYEISAWYGIGMPKGAPPEVVNTLVSAIETGLASPALKTRLADLGSSPFAISSDEFAKFIAAETEKWAKVVKFANIKSG